LVETADLEAAERTDVNGIQIILQQTRRTRAATGRPLRFIFVSSQSARPEAANVYGRSKWRAETMLVGPDEIVVRPGLIFNGSETGVYGTIRRLVRLPVLPRLGETPAIQPIHVDDLAEALLKIAQLSSDERLWFLGEVEPMRFADLIDAVARSMRRRPPLLIPFPMPVLHAVVRVADLIFWPASSLTERFTGLAALTPLDTEASLERLAMKLRPIAPRRHTRLRRRLERRGWNARLDA
jgi:NADH dehydrogenase